jgi:hypothetical protein
MSCPKALSATPLDSDTSYSFPLARALQDVHVLVLAGGALEVIIAHSLATPSHHLTAAAPYDLFLPRSTPPRTSMFEPPCEDDVGGNTRYGQNHQPTLHASSHPSPPVAAIQSSSRLVTMPVERRLLARLRHADRIEQCPLL